MTQVNRFGIYAYKTAAVQAHSMLTIPVASPGNAGDDGGYLVTGPLGGSGLSIQESTHVNKAAINRLAVVDKYIWMLQGDTLYRLPYETDPLGCDGQICNAWESVHVFTQMEAGKTGRNTGIYPCFLDPSGTGYQRYIVATYNATVAGATSWKGIRHNLDTGVTETSTATDLGFAAAATNGNCKAEIFYRNRLYFVGDGNAAIGVYNPQTNSLATIAITGSDTWGPYDFCPYKNRLWMVNRGRFGAGAGTNNLRFWEVTGGQPVLRLALTGIVPSTASEHLEGRCALFTDRTYLYTAYNTVVSGVGGFYIHRISGDDSGNITFVDSKLAFGGATNALGQVRSFAEQNSYPDIAGTGMLITLNFDEAGATGILRKQFAFNGPGAALTEEASLSGNNAHYVHPMARTHIKNGGGERIWNVHSDGAGPRIEVVGISGGSVTGSLGLDYKIITNTYFHNGTPCAVQLKWDTNSHLPITRGRIRSTSVGTLAENDTVIRITSPASGVIYNMEWDYGYHGIPSASIPLMNLFISTTGTS